MAVTGAYVTQVSSTTNASSYTFAATATGTAAADRVNPVAVTIVRSSGTTSAVSDLDVNGVQGTMRVQRSSFTQAVLEIWDAPNPTGTTGDIVVTCAETEVNCNIGVWEITGADPTPTDSDVTTATSTNEAELTTVTIPTDGFGIFSWHASTNGAVTWSGADERYDVTVESRQHSGADTSTPGTPTVHVTEAISGSKVLIGLAYGPAAAGGARTDQFFLMF